MNINKIMELTKLDNKTLVERCLKGSEELGELSEAVLSYVKVAGCDYKNKTIDDIIEEGIDLHLIVMSLIIQAQGYKFDEKKFNEILNRKLNKWEEKIKGVTKPKEVHSCVHCDSDLRRFGVVLNGTTVFLPDIQVDTHGIIVGYAPEFNTNISVQKYNYEQARNEKQIHEFYPVFYPNSNIDEVYGYRCIVCNGKITDEQKSEFGFFIKEEQVNVNSSLDFEKGQYVHLIYRKDTERRNVRRIAIGRVDYVDHQNGIVYVSYSSHKSPGIRRLSFNADVLSRIQEEALELLGGATLRG